MQKKVIQLKKSVVEQHKYSGAFKQTLIRVCVEPNDYENAYDGEF
jgi:hypothetical protein